jgi:uncharacterized membrane protein YjfL (UPF0719 family)
MSKWFPDVDDQEGVNEALKLGYFGAIAFAVMIGLGMVFLLFAGHLPGEIDGDSKAAGIVGIGIEMVVALIAAWRFKNGKGLVWGSVVLLMFVVEIALKIGNGSTNVGWFIAYAAIAMALVNGIRGAWAQRTMSFGFSELAD